MKLTEILLVTNHQNRPELSLETALTMNTRDSHYEHY
jgi:hypothetical protein